MNFKKGILDKWKEIERLSKVLNSAEFVDDQYEKLYEKRENLALAIIVCVRKNNDEAKKLLDGYVGEINIKLEEEGLFISVFVEDDYYNRRWHRRYYSLYVMECL